MAVVSAALGWGRLDELPRTRRRPSRLPRSEPQWKSGRAPLAAGGAPTGYTDGR